MLVSIKNIKKSEKTLIFALFWSIFFIINLILVLFIYSFLDSNEYNLELFTMSIFLFNYIIFIVLLNLKNLFSIKIFFSFLYFGFSLSGFYFSYYPNLSNARFILESGINFDINDINITYLLILIGYVSFIYGTNIVNNLKTKNLNISSKILTNSYLFITNISYLLFSIGLIYWLYLSYFLVGGPIELLLNLGTYETLYKTQISTLPYNFTYTGVYLLFLTQLQNNRLKKFTLLLILISFIMILTKARLINSILYLVSFIMIYLIYYQINIKIKYTFYIVAVFLFLIALYFLRYYSNLLYNNIELDSNLVDLGLYLLIGRGNIGDFQSIILAQDYIDKNNLLLGSSFLDFFRFWIDKIPGISLDMTSTGIRIKEYYFSSMIGAPAPSILSELILNFGIIGVVFGMVVLGILLNILSKIILANRGIINIFIYVKFLLFVFLLPKVDSTAISTFIMGILPLIIMIFFLNKLQIISKKGKLYAN